MKKNNRIKIMSGKEAVEIVGRLRLDLLENLAIIKD